MTEIQDMDWQVNKSALESTKYILHNRLHCDVSFKVGDKQETVPAHKLILRMRSPVFEGMFSGSFCEAETDPVVPDVSPAAFQALLRYCYYDCLDVPADVALTVLYAATKYMLPILEKAARETLIKHLDNSKIWAACKYSTDVEDEVLYNGCILYLKGHLSSGNMLAVTRYAVSVGDEGLHACCRAYIQGHLTGTNIWEVYKYALNEGDIEVHQHCRAYFQRDVTPVREALQSEALTNLPHDMLLDLLHINDISHDSAISEDAPGISISEIELFEACNLWAEAECLRQGLDPTGANKRTVLGECLSLIRFPTMLQKDLMTVVYPLSILTQPEIVDLCQYLHNDLSSECMDYPSKERQFTMTTAGVTQTVYLESQVRVLLSRVWTYRASSHKVTVTNKKSQRSWSMVLEPRREAQVAADSSYFIYYMDVEPQVLEPGARYIITAGLTHDVTRKRNQPSVHCVKVKGKSVPYQEVKVTQEHGSGNSSPQQLKYQL